MAVAFSYAYNRSIKCHKMNEFEERIHTLKVEYKRNKAAVQEDYRQKVAELKQQLATVSQIKGTPMLLNVIQTIKEQQRLLRADRDRKLSKFGRTYHFWRKETLAEMEAFYCGNYCAVAPI